MDVVGGGALLVGGIGIYHFYGALMFDLFKSILRGCAFRGRNKFNWKTKRQTMFNIWD